MTIIPNPESRKAAVFTKEEIDRWKPVSVINTIQVGNRAFSGVNFAKCSKSMVYDSFERRNPGYGVDREKFCELMDKVAEATVTSKRLLSSSVFQILHPPKPL